VAQTRSNLGLILAENKKTEAAVATQREAVATAEQISDEFLRLDALATCRNNLAEALDQAQRPAEAEPVFRQCLRDDQALAGRFPDDVEHRRGRAMVVTNLAAVPMKQDRSREPLAFIKPLGSNAAFQEHRAGSVGVHEALRQQLQPKKL
jgi:hypothetical protein